MGIYKLKNVVETSLVTFFSSIDHIGFKFEEKAREKENRDLNEGAYMRSR